MKTPKNKKPFLKASGISIGLAAFLVVGLSGCDGSNDSVATKQQKCKLDSYKEQHPEECNYLKSVYGNTSVNNTNSNSHSSGTSWVPMWMMMNSMNSHAGYSYGPSSNGPTTSKSSSYFSSSSGGHSSGSSSGG